MFELDRTYGKGHNHENAEKDSGRYKKMTVDERLAIVMYLNSIAYGFDVNNPPRMDKTYFRTRKHAIK